MKKFFRKILFLVNIIAVFALLLVYLSYYISPEKFWVLAFVGLAYPYILFTNLGFIIFWLIARKKYFFFSFIAILIGLSFFFRIFQFKAKSSDNVDVKVLTYNVRNFYGNKNDGKQKENAQKIIDLFEKEDADIICLQETRLQRAKIFNLSKAVERLKNVNHYQFARSSSSFGSVTMTRFPIVGMGEIRFEKSNNIAIYTDVLIKSDTVRVYNLHLQSYHIDPRNYSVLESMEINDEKKRKIYRKVAGSMKKAFIMRAQQVKKVREDMDNCHFPIIVCGDFNDTPNSYAYNIISNNMTDAFVNSGKGLGRSYVGDLPSFRIDYIFYDSNFDAFNYKTPNIYYSDHLPVTCGLKISEP